MGEGGIIKLWKDISIYTYENGRSRYDYNSNELNHKYQKLKDYISRATGNKRVLIVLKSVFKKTEKHALVLWFSNMLVTGNKCTR